MASEILNMFLAESAMGKAARGATEFKTERVRKKYVKQLFALASEHALAVSPLEGTSDPAEIAHNHLVLTTQDDRLILDPGWPVDPGDAYSLRLEWRRSNLPKAEAILEKIINAN